MSGLPHPAGARGGRRVRRRAALAEVGRCWPPTAQRLAARRLASWAGPWPSCAARPVETPSARRRDYLRRARRTASRRRRPPATSVWPAISPSCFIRASGSRTSPCTAWPASHGGTPLNLIVDNDTVKTTLAALPGRVPLPPVTETVPSWHAVPFDRWTGETPYEERPVQDAGLFASFAERVRRGCCGWSYRAAAGRLLGRGPAPGDADDPLLGERFAAARRTLRAPLGLSQPGSAGQPALRQRSRSPGSPAHLLAQPAALPRDLQRLRPRLPPAATAFAAATIRCRTWPRKATGWRRRSGPGAPARTRSGCWPGRTATGLELRCGDEIWPTLPWRPGDDPRRAGRRLAGAWASRLQGPQPGPDDHAVRAGCSWPTCSSTASAAASTTS